MERAGGCSIIVLGLVCLPGLAFAEPPRDERPQYRIPQLSHGWGDPEDSEPADPSWTWFGMGYEQRSRTADGQGSGPGNDGGQSNIRRGVGEN